MPRDEYKVLDQPIAALASMLPLSGFKELLRDNPRAHRSWPSARFGLPPKTLYAKLLRPTPFDND